MSNVTVQRVSDAGKRTLPVFEDIAKRFEVVKQRAFDLFEKHGCECGYELDDWLQAEREVLGWPPVEWNEDDAAYEAQISLPGFHAKDVEVTATPSEIIVHAGAEHQTKTEEGEILWTESGSNEVYRRFETPQPIDTDRVTARLDKGVLRITATKATAAKSKPVAAAA